MLRYIFNNQLLALVITNEKPI